jgi:nucleotide-binding universal stress UspA family protein
MFTNIVWATDGSEAADRALDTAKELALAGDGSLIVLHCKELFVGRAGGYPVYADENELQEKIRKQADELRDAGLVVGLRMETATAHSPAHAIAEAARELNADVIVVGTRGHTPLAGLLLGSVTQRLLHIATCPVLAVPAKAGGGTKHEEELEQAVAH